MPDPSSSSDSSSEMLSSRSKDLLAKVRMMVPPMLEHFHKGQLGRVAVIGGSEDYTGAPYFSAMASAHLGADMSHVICEPDAGQVIKTYSPNLMVHPLMRQSTKRYRDPSDPSREDRPDAKSASKPIIDMLSRVHAIVIGPGLGRDPLMQDICAEVVREARKRNIPFVLDADGLQLVGKAPELVKGYRECILTPNVVEFSRLAKALDVHVDEEDRGKACSKLSNALDGVCIVQKGGEDVISNGKVTWSCDLQGGRKRSGGQGDTLTGSIVTFLAWRKAYLDGLWKTDGDLKGDELLMLSAWGGCAITRECSRLAFKKMGRALQASDVGEEVPRAFESLIGEKEASKL